MTKYQTYVTKATLVGLLLFTGLQLPIHGHLQEVQAETKQGQVEVLQEGEYSYSIKEDGTALLVAYTGEKTLENYQVPTTIGGYSVSEIGTGMYQDMDVQTFEIAGHIKKIQKEAFKNSHMDKLILKEANDTKGERMVYENTTIGEIEFKDTTKIGNSLFSGAKIERFALPESIEEIGAWAFFGANLTGNIELDCTKPYGEGVFFMSTINGHITVQNMTDEEKEYEYGENNPYFQMFFQSVINGDIAITNSDYVGYHLLAESEINGEVHIAGKHTVIGNHLFRNAKIQKVSMTGTVENITDNAFLNVEVTEPMVIEADVDKIGFSYFDKENNGGVGTFINANLNGLIFKGKLGKINEYSFIRGNVGELRLEKGLDIGYQSSFINVGLKKVHIVGDVGTLNGYMVLNNNEDTIDYDVAIQGNIQNYGGYNNDLGIREEGSVDNYSNGVFTGSRNITIDGNVQNIGERAFMNTNEIHNDSIIINGNIGRIGTQAFQSNKGDLKIKGNVGQIMRIAFLSYTGDVTIQGDVAEIGSLNDREEYETILTGYEGNFNIMGDIGEIHDNGMANYGSVYSLYVGGNIPYVGVEGLAYVSKIQVDGELGEIGNRAFYNYGRNAEREIVNKVPKSIIKNVTKIGDEAFRYNQVEDDIVFPETLKEIGDNAFTDTGLTKVKLPKGLQQLGAEAFSLNKLACITIPKGVTKTAEDMIMQENGQPIEVYGTEAKGHKLAYSKNYGVTFIENSIFTNECDKETWGVQVNAKTVEGKLLQSDYITEPKEGRLTIEAPNMEGYLVKGEKVRELAITDDTPNHVVDFVYEPIKPEPPVEKPDPPTEPNEPTEKPDPPTEPNEPTEKPEPPAEPSEPNEKPEPPAEPSEPTEKPEPPAEPSEPTEKPEPPAEPSEPNEKPEPPAEPSEPTTGVDQTIIQKPLEKEETDKEGSETVDTEKEETLPKTGTEKEPVGLWGLLIGMLGYILVRKK